MAHSLRCRLKELWRRGMLRDGDLERIVIIPKDATNGDAIKALYPNKTFFNEDLCCVTMKEYGKTEEDIRYLTYIDFDGDWWDAPYKGGE